MHCRALNCILSVLLFACSLLLLAVSSLGQVLRRTPVLFGRNSRRAAGRSVAFAVHSAGEFDFHRALEAYERLIDAQGAARQT